MRIPLAYAGFSLSNGNPFLLQVMLTLCSKFSASKPVML